MSVTKNPQRSGLILLSGWATTNACWDDCLSRLRPSCPCRRIELPGHGMAVGQSPLEREQFIDYLYHSTPSDSVWIGWSLGGMIAQQLACRHPHHVKRLVCIAASLKFLSADDWPDALPADEFSLFSSLFNDDPDQARRRFLNLICTRELKRPARLRLQAMVMRAKDRRGLRWGLDCLARHDARAAMAAYTGSVSFIGGAHDRLVPAASLHASSRLLSRSRTFIVPQAGHALPISHPQRLAECLLDCLDHADVH